MAWFKIEVNYGGGHQGHDVSYVYYERKVPEKELDGILEDYVHNHYYHTQASATMERVSRLPKEVRRRKIVDFLQEKESADEMLEVLRYKKGEDLSPPKRKKRSA